jgi:uncharacterized protein YbjT (DUF2867 family)
MQPARKIAVAGATGRLGRHIVDVLRAQGHDVVPISRSLGVDVITGEGLAEALTGVERIIDAATQPSPEEDAATAFFTASAHNLQELGEKAGVQRIVLVSIVGVDQSTGGYYAAKLAQEQAMLAGPIPVRILRATQFHEFVPEIVEWGRQGDVIYVPKMRTQLVAARSVAEALAGMVDGSGAVPGADDAPIAEVGGPREERLVEMARLLLSRRGDTSRIEEVSNPDDPHHELYENGGLLPGPDATLAGPTFEEWLDAQG